MRERNIARSWAGSRPAAGWIETVGKVAGDMGQKAIFFSGGIIIGLLILAVISGGFGSYWLTTTIGAQETSGQVEPGISYFERTEILENPDDDLFWKTRYDFDFPVAGRLLKIRALRSPWFP